MHSCALASFCSELSGAYFGQAAPGGGGYPPAPPVGPPPHQIVDPAKGTHARASLRPRCFSFLASPNSRDTFCFRVRSPACAQTAAAPATCGAASTRARTGAPGRASRAAAPAAACRRARPATRRPAASATRAGPRTATGPNARERRRAAGGWGGGRRWHRVRCSPAESSQRERRAHHWPVLYCDPSALDVGCVRSAVSFLCSF